MSKLIIRHGLSEANDRESAAFGLATAPLKPEGIIHGIETGLLLRELYGIDPETTAAAASTMLRSQQTARAAGFLSVRHYALLDEVNVPKTREFSERIGKGMIINEALTAADELLANPPKEAIWFSHGYLIAALCHRLGIDTTDKRFIPHFGEVRELPIE